jgi:2'-5' RNA ligase
MADEQEHTGGMIALVPADPGSLAVDGGDPADELHLTLAYLGNDVAGMSEAMREALTAHVAQFSQDVEPLETRIMGHALWNPDGGPDGDMEPCAIYQVQDDERINSARMYAQDMAAMVMGADFPQQHPGFLPHVTAGYGIQPSALSYAGPVTFDRVRLALGGDVTDFPLSGMHSVYTTEGGWQMAATKTIEEAPPEADAEPPKLDENSGIPVTFPVIIVEGLETSDGRYIEAGALSHRALPLPILAQTRNPEGGDGHAGADVIGRLDTLERVDGSEVIDKETGKPFGEGVFVWRGTGFIDPEAAGTKLAQKGYLTGNSADLSDVEAEFLFDESEDGEGVQQIRMTSGKIAATTLVPIPAFAQAYVQIDGETVEPNEEAITAGAAPAWLAAEVGDECFLCTAGIPEGFAVKQVTEIVAAATPIAAKLPPTHAFADPVLDGPTALTLDEDSIPGFVEVYGHLATWGTCHTGFAGQCVTPPRSRQDYGYFNVGAVRTRDVDEVKVVAAGHITMGEGGHAGLKLSAMEAVAHYDNINTVVADVTAGEDAFGIWVHGVIRLSATPQQIDALRASPLSGDWRPIDGSLELVAALAVNSGGFPIPRARVASGVPMALVAAGVVPQPETNAEFENREPVATGAVVLDYDVLADAIAKRLNGEITIRINEETQARGEALRAAINGDRAAELRDGLLGPRADQLRAELTSF